MSQSLGKPRILFLITQGEWGGAQRYVFDLATNLEKNNYDVLVVIGPEKLDLKARLEGRGVKVRLAQNLRRNLHPLGDIAAIFELKQIFLEFAPHITHLNSTKAGILGSLAGKLAGVKNIVFTAHGFHFLEPVSVWSRKFSFWLEKFATIFRKKIICVSDFDRQEAIKAKLCPPEKLVTIHNGINFTGLLKPEIGGLESDSGNKILNSVIRHPTSDIRHPKVIGTIANLYPTKGLEYLLEAANLLNIKHQIPNSVFIIIGEGPERKNLESRIKNRGLEKQFFLLGKIPDAARYLPSFNLFVLPSIKEGWPYTILEAMAAGLPIIATAVGGIPEMLTPETGILVGPKNPQALAQAIKKVLADPELSQKLGRRARERIKEFSFEKMLQATEKNYREMLDG